ncbi:MAG: DUF1573 domain-containing protein [Alistipes sp.]|nr:DUF1573 domain-containing protein [Alistipes sp.]MBR5200170.1 DUF1573 domain-containing protein [Alistipes sp.]
MRAFLMCFMLLATSFVVQADEPKGAEIEFPTKIVDLGTLSRDDDKQIVRLSFTNTGDVPLVVTEVRTTCSCTTIQHDRKKVMPTERGVLTITMDPSKAPVGSFYRVLQVYSTATNGVQHITLKAEIE